MEISQRIKWRKVHKVEGKRSGFKNNAVFYGFLFHSSLPKSSEDTWKSKKVYLCVTLI